MGLFIPFLANNSNYPTLGGVNYLMQKPVLSHQVTSGPGRNTGKVAQAPLYYTNLNYNSSKGKGYFWTEQTSRNRPEDPASNTNWEHLFTFKNWLLWNYKHRSWKFIPQDMLHLRPAEREAVVVLMILAFYYEKPPSTWLTITSITCHIISWD